MRILLDESLPKELRDELASHEVMTVRESGWSGRKNGELLSGAADQFDVVMTADQNLQFQQNLSKLPNHDRTPTLLPLPPRLPPRHLLRVGRSGEFEGSDLRARPDAQRPRLRRHRQGALLRVSRALPP